MSLPLVKICGLTRAQDVEAAVTHGAAALGFVFAQSPRRLQAGDAARLTHMVPDGIMRVGLFMDQDAEAIEAILEAVDLDLLQFHGREDNAFCAGFGQPWIKAVSMHGEATGLVARQFPDASGILLDSHEPGKAGGTGHSFDWTRSPELDKPLWLAGGLRPGNVAEAVRRFRPFAVDVSSGVEDSPGEKNAQLIKAFIEQARQETYDIPGK